MACDDDARHAVGRRRPGAPVTVFIPGPAEGRGLSLPEHSD